jgi:cysteine synthase A|tara:strand:+ start:55 stop:924 length:870 start_codon:yes stop_codon:yes gene_type:complete
MQLLESVGNTPMLKISDGLYAKAELLNPTGSIKDRPASWILRVQDPKSKGIDTICEATSGNMGVSFAWLAASMGLKCVIVMPDNMSIERKKTLEYYGAKLIEVPAGDFDGAIAYRDKLCEENGWFNCNQFANEYNIESHFFTTGQEILNWAVEGRHEISAMVTGTGTGGTLMGCSRRIHQGFPDMKVVAVEPAESAVMSGGEPGLHGIQGIGDGSKFLVNMEQVDFIQQISTEEAKDRARALAQSHGLFVGISAGANILASERYIKTMKPKGDVVTFLCDRGDRYFSCL